MKVERHKEALEHLFNYLEKRKLLDGWDTDLQDLMIVLVEVCVEMQNAWKAKQALARYRHICVACNASVNPVVEHFLEACHMKAKSCLQDLKRQGLELNMENLGANFDQFTPEDHRATWFDFAWEVHQMLLDVFNNHSAFESAYNTTVQRVLTFCLAYRRVDEFNDISNRIRYHLNVLVKNSGRRPNFPSLKDVRTAHNYLTTRFVQLRIAVELKQWQEAFRSIQDIDFLAEATQLSLSFGMMCSYFAQLSKIFKAVDFDLYHAISSYISLSLEKDGMSSSEFELKASAVLLAALSAPLYDDNRDRKYQDTVRKDSIFMGASKEMLSREVLLSKLLSEDILVHVTPQVRELFHLVEEIDAIECYPANLAAEAQSLLSTLHLQLANDYGSKLWKLIALRVLKKVSETYHILKFEDIQSMLPFLTLSEVKHLLIEAAQHGFFDNKVEWCARKGVIHFKGHGSERHDYALSNRLMRLAKAREFIYSMARPTKIRRVVDFPSYSEKPIHTHDCEMHMGRWRDGSYGEYLAEEQEEEEEADLTTSTSSTNSSAEADADTWRYSPGETDADTWHYSPGETDDGTWHHMSRERPRFVDSWRPNIQERQYSDDSWRSRNAQLANLNSTESETVETTADADYAPRGRTSSSDDAVRGLCFHCRYHSDQGR